LFREHFDQLAPVCPACGGKWPLRIGEVARLEAEEILEAALLCTNPHCQREHPVIDGIPVVLADANSWFASQGASVLRREDFSDFLETILGDLAGAGSTYDRERGNLGIYAHAHWAPGGATYLPVFDAGMSLLATPPAGVWLDAGCSLGRGVFELVRRGASLAVGVDLNFAMLRLARRIVTRGKVDYWRRRVGIAFDRLQAPLPGEVDFRRMSFWCADVAAIPFPEGRFAGGQAVNLLDCVASPLDLIRELARVTAKEGEVILSTPFDWAAGASPAAVWIGGHTQRYAPEGGSSLAMLRHYLERMELGFRLAGERDGVLWRLETNERSVTEYRVFVGRLLKKK
jgi:SAM-dependent methyltransferase/uncharacterized protein YbaR (Trm112 family)